MSNTIIQLKSSSSLGNVPSVLFPGELAINFGDGKLYYGNTSNQAVLFDAITEPTGLNEEIQFNDSGSFGSSANLKFNSSTKTLTTHNLILTGNANVQNEITTNKYIAFFDGSKQYTANAGSGAQGVQGAVGAQGVQGAVGAQGVQGAVGAQGVQGATGAVGAQGVQGATGAGAQGAVGAQGADGGAGAQGTAGTDGSAFGNFGLLDLGSITEQVISNGGFFSTSIDLQQ